MELSPVLEESKSLEKGLLLSGRKREQVVMSERDPAQLSFQLVEGN